MADRSSASTTELEARDRAIVERVAAGLSLRAVGVEYGLSHSVVRKITARAGVHSSCRRGPPPWPAHRIAELRQLRSEGLSVGEISHRLGVGQTTVRRLITQHGMPMLAPLQRKKRSGSGKSKHARNRAIAARIAAGATHSKAGAEFGISRQRVSRIMLALRATDRICDR
jgi:excisionase family DNA binding protein